MEHIRIIHADRSAGDMCDERIAITTEMDTPAEDYFPTGFEVISDTVHDIELPSGFPVDHTFRKEIL